MATDTPDTGPPAGKEKPQDEAEQLQPAPSRPRRRDSQWAGTSRTSLLGKLLREKTQVDRELKDDLEKGSKAVDSSTEKQMSPTQKQQVKKDTDFLAHAKAFHDQVYANANIENLLVEVRLDDFNYRVKVNPESQEIKTVKNQSTFYKIWQWMKRVHKREPRPAVGSKLILEKISLVLKPGRMYLVLGPPASGKTTLLKAISGRLATSNGETLEGPILYNGLSLKDKSNIVVENLITFIAQSDDHAPRLTVFETFNFAFQCVAGGRIVPNEAIKDDAGRKVFAQMARDHTQVKLVEESLGLSHVADTFVGNNEVRGVSGGQRRRVTLGEMFQQRTPILCADEISTGLDAQSTFSIVESIMTFTKAAKMTRVISLLQPGPETVSLFDEIILISEGKIMYAGPVESVEEYFASLGYQAPEQCDVADFLQVVSTPDGAQLYVPPEGSTKTTPYTNAELADAFRSSQLFQKIKDEQKAPWDTDWSTSLNLMPSTANALKEKYANSAFRSTWLNLRRNIIIWTRDKRFLIANAIKNVIMGISVGGVFFQTDSISSIYGVLFQLTLFIMLGAMTSIPEQVSDRTIFYKHCDDNFYGAFAYVIGKATSLLPQTLMDVLTFGTIIYFMVGLATTAENYFIFVAVLFAFSIVMNQMLGIFASFAPTKSAVQAASACVMLFLIVFCGFIVAPTVIPNYYIWIYWWNPLAWAYRAVVVNEFSSYKYDGIDPQTGKTDGDLALESGGFVWNGEPFGKEWIGYAFAYLVPYTLLCIFVSGLFYKFKRVESGGGAPSPPTADSVADAGDSAKDEQDADDVLEIPFTQVTLSFSNLNYDVKASKGKETLRLLNGPTGIFQAGRMCALMGSSGAGKTTLMDVIALRKNTGTVTGDVRLNGFEQEKISFRRCSGYVEQFDVQASELTVRETVLYSARLRLDSEDPALAGDEIKQKFVDETLKVLELTPIADCLVGTDETGGLSFEQRKRLSIAVELAASPSIIFLDEPTSGLDARAAILVVKVLRKIADTGRTVIATIHQPSSPVFDLFDDLCLLKKGGRVTFFGELGNASANLVDYFESRNAHPISIGENPANWMLDVLSSDTNTDWAEEWDSSPELDAIKTKIQEVADNNDPEMEIKYDRQYAASWHTRRKLASQRLVTVYLRSPAYNRTRMVVSMFIAFILGSVFVTKRRPPSYTEQQLTSLFSTIFISFIIIGILGITSVLPVMLEIRDTFYRQRAAGMVDNASLALALGTAEKRFIVLASALFCVIFLPMIGTNNSLARNFAFWGFFTFNSALYSYFGQAFMACVRGMSTAQILASVFIGLNNFFSGLIVRPQYLNGIFAVTYWITPGHYVYEGLIMTSFYEDETPVIATFGTVFQEQVCPDISADETCEGTVSEFVEVFFGGRFQWDNLWIDAVVLGGYLILSRVSTFLALRYFNYTST